MVQMISTTLPDDIFNNQLLDFLDDASLDKLKGNMVSNKQNTNIHNKIVSRRIYNFDDYLKLPEQDRKHVKYIIYDNPHSRINAGVLPNGLKYLDILCGYDYSFDVGVLPKNLTHLTVKGSFCRAFTNEDYFPDGLTYLETGWGYDKPFLPGVLPDNLQVLKLGSAYNHTFLPGVLPKYLQHLRLGDCYNKPFDENVLPNHLNKITFGPKYNKPIKRGVLPDSLKELSFGLDFNQPIGENVYPPGLTHLKFSAVYNHHGDEIVYHPKWMRRSSYNQRFGENNVLPPRLEFLQLPPFYVHSIPLYTPQSLVYVSYGFSKES